MLERDATQHCVSSTYQVSSGIELLLLRCLRSAVPVKMTLNPLRTGSFVDGWLELRPEVVPHSGVVRLQRQDELDLLGSDLCRCSSLRLPQNLLAHGEVTHLLVGKSCSISSELAEPK